MTFNNGFLVIHHSTELRRGKVKLTANQRGYVFPGLKQIQPEVQRTYVDRLRNSTGFGTNKGLEFDIGKVIEV